MRAPSSVGTGGCRDYLAIAFAGDIASVGEAGGDEGGLGSITIYLTT